MRFRKVRSLLSAYSNDELDAKRSEQLREQLAQSNSLKREALVFDKIKAASKELPSFELSDDFNARLLNRIAHERFAETRTKAYLPKSINGLFRRYVVPAMATAAVALIGFVGLSNYQPSSPDPVQLAGVSSDTLDDSYLSAQPIDNPKYRKSDRADRTLAGLIARVDHANRMTALLTGSSQWGGNNRLAGQMTSRQKYIPFSIQYFRIRPVLRVKASVPQMQGEETTY
jgi:hypothetical protein